MRENEGRWCEMGKFGFVRSRSGIGRIVGR